MFSRYVWCYQLTKILIRHFDRQDLGISHVVRFYILRNQIQDFFLVLISLGKPILISCSRLWAAPASKVVIGGFTPYHKILVFAWCQNLCILLNKKKTCVSWKDEFLLQTSSLSSNLSFLRADCWLCDPPELNCASLSP